MKKLNILLLLMFLSIISCQKKEAALATNADSLKNVFNPAKQIKIGAIYSLSGSDAVNNERGLNGTRLAVEEINRQGGINGKTIFLQIYDDESSAAGAQSCAEKAAADSVLAVLGCTYSSNALAVAPILQQNSLPFLLHIATNPAITAAGDYIFRVCFINTFQSRLLAKFVLSDLQKKEAAVIFEENNQYSTDLKDEFIKAFGQAGGRVSAIVSYKKEDTDFSGQLAKIKKSNSPVLFIPAYTAKSGMIIRQAVNLGLKTVFLGGDGWSDRLFNYADSAAAGSFFLDHWDLGLDDAKSRTFTAAYKARYADKLQPNSDAALAYDAVYLLREAIVQTGSFKRNQIRDQLQKCNFQGVTGAIKFDEFRNPHKQAVIKKIGKSTIEFYQVIKLN